MPEIDIHHRDGRLRAAFYCLDDMHWSEKYVGDPYIPGIGDCAALAAKVAREVLGINCSLPLIHASGLRNQAEQINRCKDALAYRLDKPVEAQPALFIGRGRTCHIGVMCWLSGEWWVLHADMACGCVVRQKLREMIRVRYQLEGYYAWK